MSGEPGKIVLIALDEALAERVMRLFDVLMADASEEGMKRFLAGLEKLLYVHALAVSSCTATASSGS
jgi:hypothetical protein